MVEVIKISLEQVRSMDDFHDLVLKEFSFPYYYGRNLDAFWDCIAGTSGQTRVQITGHSSVEPALREKIDQYIGLLKDYEKENGEFRVVVVQ